MASPGNRTKHENAPNDSGTRGHIGRDVALNFEHKNSLVDLKSDPIKLDGSRVME